MRALLSCRPQSIARHQSSSCEQDSLPQQLEAGPAEHLALEHEGDALLDAPGHRFPVHTPRSPWRDLPDELGSFQTAHKRLLRWAVDGTWERILAALLAAADRADDIGSTVSVDSPSAGPTSTPPEPGEKGFPVGPNLRTMRSAAPEAA
jgi:hypothetical protein